MKSVTSSPSYWRELYRAKWVILGISLTMLLLSWAGMLEHLETTGLDTFNILKPPRDPQHVVIVAIDDDDYNNLFRGTSHLESAILQQILCGIAQAKPKLIAVDIDTSAVGFGALQTEAEWPSIVWARDAMWNEKGDKIHSLFQVLGGKNPARLGDVTAVAQLPADSGDGIVRRYHRTLPLEMGGEADSLPWAIAKAACEDSEFAKACKAIRGAEKSNDKEPERGVLLNFAGERFDFKPLATRRILSMIPGGASASSPCAVALPGWREHSPLRNRIVLLGGYYHAARDKQVTPIGEMPGVQLVAQTVEMELNGGGIRPINEIAAFILDLLSGALLIYINYRNPRNLARALWISLLLLAIVPLVASYLAFSTFSRWFNFVPMIVGVLIHELYEHAKEYHHLRAQYLRS